MTELPDETRARLERILADAELAAIAAAALPDDIRHFAGGFIQVRPAAGSLFEVALTAAVAIVETIGPIERPATGRRLAVDEWLTQLSQQLAIDRARLLAKLRQHAAWLTFQKRLRGAERTDIPSFGQQLTAFMQEVHWADEDAAAATQSNPRTVERHRTGKQPPTRRSIAEYEKALSAVRGPTSFREPPSSPPTRAGRKRRPKKS